ncbi:MAG TPA: GNAT family N-acetyltransferase [Steroidobacteraceae bacterium]|nr:GNAT family N-acetyltransferase [Steroidobacteraceae bacterium]
MDAAAHILETPRVRLREATLADGPFLLRLLNEPSWRENIGDRGVRSVEDAERYIRDRIWSQYEAHGFGMYTVELKSTGRQIGLCGLVKREYLSAPDVGFALLPEYVGCGYAMEAATRLLAHASNGLGLTRLYAITKPTNARSMRLLERLGLHREGPYLTPQGEEVELWIANCTPSAFT